MYAAYITACDRMCISALQTTMITLRQTHSPNRRSTQFLNKASGLFFNHETQQKATIKSKTNRKLISTTQTKYVVSSNVSPCILASCFLERPIESYIYILYIFAHKVLQKYAQLYFFLIDSSCGAFKASLPRELLLDPTNCTGIYSRLFDNEL